MQQVVLITGVSSGIGEATARTLANAGYRVFGGARSPEKVAAMPGVEVLQLDVRDDASVGSCVAKVMQQAGRIDIVINNAGVALVGPVEATNISEAETLFDTNLFGILRVCRAVLPIMRRQNSGLIVNMSSVLGFLPAPFMGLYAASKHAVEGLSETLDHEVRTFGIRVILIEPSFTNTKLDLNAKQTAETIGAYAGALSRSSAAVRKQIEGGPQPSAVAATIERVLRSRPRMRKPADGRASLLSTLRRYVPASQFDKSLRKAFGL